MSESNQCFLISASPSRETPVKLSRESCKLSDLQHNHQFPQLWMTDSSQCVGTRTCYPSHGRERDETDLNFAAHTVPILSEEIFNSMVQESPFHEEDSKMGQKAHQKSLDKIVFREEWSPSCILSILESITLSWVLSHSFSIIHFFNEISFFCVPFYNHTKNYNVTSSFVVQNEEGNKGNGFSQWGLDVSQKLKIKDSHTICFYSNELEMHSFYKRTFFVVV